jgi:hypothetical protein
MKNKHTDVCRPEKAKDGGNGRSVALQRLMTLLSKYSKQKVW